MSAPRGAVSNPSLTLSQLVARKDMLEDELRNVEKQVYDLETSYLHDSAQSGNVLKGFEGFLTSSKGGHNLKRPKKFQSEDRLFSLSSVTSPASRALQVEEKETGQQLEGRAAEAPSQAPRSKGAALPANGPGKHLNKRNRSGPREGKRIKQASELEEEDDDADGALR